MKCTKGNSLLKVIKKTLGSGILLGALSVLALPVFSQSFVDMHGLLKVQGNKIVDKNNQVMTLRGMSMYAWSSAGLQFYNATAVGRLVKEWKCTVIRIPILPAQVSSQESQVKTVVDACIANGVYAIIDWHSMTGANATDCSNFMKRMATAYGSTPNVMYETWNEPETESWTTIKAYHQTVISAIRSIDPDNIIFCGCEQWDQLPQNAAANPITTSTNIVYTMHFYAATHKQWLRDNTTAALNKGVAIFSTEYGTGASDGNGTMDSAETQTWWNYMDQNNIGSANWSVSALAETTAAFNPGTSATNWTDADLKPSGVLLKNYLVSKNSSLFNTTTPTATPTPTPTGLLGDVNGDGLININDALLTARFSAGLNPSPFNQSLADVTRDGAVNINDALRIAQYSAGIITSF